MAQSARKYNNNCYHKYNNNDSKNEQNTEGKSVLLYALFLIVLCLLLIFYISQNMRIMEMRNEIDSLHNRMEAVAEKNHQLALNYSWKTSPARIEKLARQRLNMQKPGAAQTLVLNSTEPGGESRPVNNNDDSFFLVQLAGDFWERFGVARADSPQQEDNMNE